VQESRALVVRHATVLDTRTAKTLPDRAIVMRGDRIIRVVADSALDTLRGDLRGAQVLDVRGRLVIPGLIDVHHHTAYVFPDSITPGGGAVSRLVMRADSIASYRARWASAYLSFGVTAVREVGGDERYLALMTAWMRPTPSAPDFFPSAGALVSHEEGRVPYVGHAIVRDSADAVARVRRYHDAGLRDVKLYWRLREPEYVRATVTPTLHIFAQRVGFAPYTTKSLGTFDRSDAWTPTQRDRARRGYEILAGYVRRMHEAGVGLAVGTDWLDPGHAVLSELILLQRAGIPMAEVLCIATRGGARARDGTRGRLRNDRARPQGARRHLRSQPARGSRGGAGRENRDQGRSRRSATLIALRDIMTGSDSA